RALALQSFQRNTSLESRVMVPAFLHLLISSLLKTSKSQIGASVTVLFSGSSSIWRFSIISRMSHCATVLE
ncbi:MAG: hypothetical protein ACU0DA_13660, partial [Paracoccus sp. (in: a-proteobacteria)]|uniref:hypothetical protein n=1 Tax=Paracoccus sp. TaxID=267 RepID=UPI00405A1A6B